MEAFSFSPPIILVEEVKRLLGVNSFECTISITVFSIIKPDRWRIPKNLDDDILDNLNNLLKPKSEKNYELGVNEVRKR